ncbi:MAG: uroporphyrinogen decarboxylase [Acidobacteriota bacterium]
MTDQQPPSQLQNDRLLRVFRGESVDRPPVWIMRQAGRYLPEYRAIRQRVDFLTLCKTPDLAAEVTVQPIDILGVDAAILFADILLPLEAMGAELKFVKGDGPTFPDPVRRREDLSRLRAPSVEGTLGYVFDALRAVRRALAGRVPVLGFGGTPWTLAAYLVEGSGSKQYPHLLEWSYRDPAGLGQLLERIAEVSTEYLLGQVEAGADALQLFDSWGGLLSAGRWRQVAMPPLARIIEGLRAQAPATPLIYYVQGGSHLLEAARQLPVDGISVDWRLPLAEARSLIGPDKVIQGNLDPAALLGPVPHIESLARDLVEAGRGTRHIVNLGHGIIKSTPVEHAQAFVRAVQGTSSGG